MADNRYDSKDYWEKRYQDYRKRPDFNNFRYDWYLTYTDTFREIIRQYLSKKQNDRILHLGCGNSSLAEKLWEEGWTNIINVDFSETVICDMRRQCIPLHGLQFFTMDCCDMTQFPDNSFDVIIEKGMMDSIFSSLDSISNAKKALAEVSRVLKPGGCFISITCTSPACRLSHFQDPSIDWNVDSNKIPDGPGFYAFICTKNS